MITGERIAYLRDKKGLTQETLAKLLGISRAALSHYETSRREPDYELIKKIADFFDVSIDYLVGRTDEAVPTLDPEIKDFVKHLELSDESILDTFTFTIDGRELTPEETKRFIAFVRAERSMKNEIF